MMLKKRDLETIKRVLGVDDDVIRFLKHVNNHVLALERKEIQSKVDYYVAHVLAGGPRTSPLEKIEFLGEVKSGLTSLLELAQAGNKRGARYVLHFMLGAFWEQQAMRIISRLCYDAAFHRPGKRDWLAAPRHAAGEQEALYDERSLPTADLVAFIYDRRFEIEVKLESPYSLDGNDLYFRMPSRDYKRMQRRFEMIPPISQWLLIHNHERLGKWSARNDEADWFVGEHQALGEPRIWVSSRKASTSVDDYGYDESAYWPKDRFIRLAQMLERLRQGGS